MKRLISILLVTVMLFAILPVSAITVSAEDYTDSQGVTYTLSNDGTYYIVSSFDRSVAEVVIPSEIDGIPVTSIGKYAFPGSTGLTSIAIPDSITSVGMYAFDGCIGLTAVYITDIAAWCGIDFASNPLAYAGKLYLNDTLITDLVIPDSVTSIGGHVFAGGTA